MTSADSFELVKRILVDEMGFDEADVAMDANFEYDLGGDSFDFAEMCMFLEDEGVPVDDAFTAVTLRDVVEYVVKHKGASA